MENILVNPNALAEINAVDDEASVARQKRSAFVLSQHNPMSARRRLRICESSTRLRELYLARGAYDIIAKSPGESPGVPS